MHSRYGISDFNEHGSLSAGLPLFASLLFLTRHYWFGLMVLASRSPALMASTFDDRYKFWLVAEIPALLVALLIFLRKPEAGDRIRKVWRLGFPLLLVAVLGEAGLSIDRVIGRWSSYEVESMLTIELATSVLVLAYAIFSRRPRDLFSASEFPAPKPAS